MDGTEVIKKPKVVEDYNQYVGGVDKSDQLVLYYGFAHRRVKWWERAFYPTRIRTEVGKSLLDGFQSHVSQHFMSVDLRPLLLTERPFPEPIPSDTPHGGRPQCEVC